MKKKRINLSGIEELRFANIESEIDDLVCRMRDNEKKDKVKFWFKIGIAVIIGVLSWLGIKATFLTILSGGF